MSFPQSYSLCHEGSFFLHGCATANTVEVNLVDERDGRHRHEAPMMHFVDIHGVEDEERILKLAEEVGRRRQTCEDFTDVLLQEQPTQQLPLTAFTYRDTPEGEESALATAPVHPAHKDKREASTFSTASLTPPLSPARHSGHDLRDSFLDELEDIDISVAMMDEPFPSRPITTSDLARPDAVHHTSDVNKLNSNTAGAGGMSFRSLPALQSSMHRAFSHAALFARRNRMGVKTALSRSFAYSELLDEVETPSSRVTRGSECKTRSTLSLEACTSLKRTSSRRYGKAAVKSKSTSPGKKGRSGAPDEAWYVAAPQCVSESQRTMIMIWFEKEVGDGVEEELTRERAHKKDSAPTIANNANEVDHHPSSGEAKIDNTGEATIVLTQEEERVPTEAENLAQSECNSSTHG